MHLALETLGRLPTFQDSVRFCAEDTVSRVALGDPARQIREQARREGYAPAHAEQAVRWRIGTAGRGPDLVTAAGPLLGAQVSGSLQMHGRWTSHPKYGRQFEAFSYTTVLPTTVQGIQRYLGSG